VVACRCRPQICSCSFLLLYTTKNHCLDFLYYRLLSYRRYCAAEWSINDGILGVRLRLFANDLKNELHVLLHDTLRVPGLISPKKSVRITQISYYLHDPEVGDIVTFKAPPQLVVSFRTAKEVVVLSVSTWFVPQKRMCPRCFMQLCSSRDNIVFSYFTSTICRCWEVLILSYKPRDISSCGIPMLVNLWCEYTARKIQVVQWISTGSLNICVEKCRWPFTFFGMTTPVYKGKEKDY
jgi:hypothetical protein